MQCEIYGPVVTDNKILKGKDYVLCREAMRNITEAVNRIKIEKFMEGRDEELSFLAGLVKGINDSLNLSNEGKNFELFKIRWKAVEEYLENFASYLAEEQWCRRISSRLYVSISNTIC